jgi:hypothetical protein
MDGRFVGRRGEEENEWSWDDRPGRRGRAGRANLRLRIALLAAILLLAGGVAGAFFALSSETGDEGPAAPGFSGSPSPRPTTPPATSTASPSPLASPTPALSLSWWDRAEGRWRTDSISGASGYREGEAIPFLMRLEGALVNAEYALTIAYSGCGDTPGAAFDFLTDAAAADDGAFLAAAGPGPGPPDATLGVPDDPTTAADEMASGGLLRLWGATFGEAPQGPLTDCSGGRSIRVKVLARSGAVIMMWGSHLASRADWPGAGAAGRTTPFYESVQAPPAGEAVVQAPPGAIAP